MPAAKPVAQGEEDGQAIEMAFSKKRVEDRKRWLGGYMPGTYLDQSVDTISYSDFVHKARAAVGLRAHSGGRGAVGVGHAAVCSAAAAASQA